MFAVALIFFREVLEAALVIGILAAATTGLPGRTRWILTGVGAGLAGAVITALFAERLASAAEGMGQELFNAAILFTAVLMLGWHTVWMSRHGKELDRFERRAPPFVADRPFANAKRRTGVPERRLDDPFVVTFHRSPLYFDVVPTGLQRKNVCLRCLARIAFHLTHGSPFSATHPGPSGYAQSIRHGPMPHESHA